jgi:molybdopterin synthase catalytic subunit
MRLIRVQTDDFDTAAECSALVAGRANIGAVVSFTGHVRGDDGLTALTVEHYAGMTEREIDGHVAEAESRWPLLGTTVIHRVGRLLPGERILLVTAASAHREASFQAVEFLLDYLKTRAPFWKHEERGLSGKWVEAREADMSAALRWRRM